MLVVQAVVVGSLPLRAVVAAWHPVLPMLFTLDPSAELKCLVLLPSPLPTHAV